MMFNNFKFYSEVNAITDEYPIYPSREYKRRWVKKCAHAYKKRLEITKNIHTETTTAKCPGIREIMESGYVLTTWCDITIETNQESPYDFQLYLPDRIERFLKEVGFSKPVVSSFDMRNSALKIPTGSNLKSILKLYMPWVIDIPKGWKLLIVPVAYDDDPKFTACTGILNSGLVNDFNIHILWHTTEGRVTIPAGTPICQLIPMKDSKPRISFQAITERLKETVLAKLFRSCNRFTYKY